MSPIKPIVPTLGSSPTPAAGGADFVFHLAGRIKAPLVSDYFQVNYLGTINVLEACHRRNCRRIFFSSSACIYPEYRQLDPNNPGLAESDAYPAAPDSEYG